MKRYTWAVFLFAYFLWIPTPAPLYAAPPPSASAHQNEPPVTVQLLSLRYNEQANSYTLALSLSAPSRVQRLFLAIIEEEAGVIKQEIPVDPAGQWSLQIEFDAAALQAERKYAILARATTQDGLLHQRPDDNGASTTEDPTILGTLSFTHLPPASAPLAFTIQSVTPNYSDNTLLIELGIPPEMEPRTYSGYIVAQGGQRVLDIAPTVFVEPRLEVPMPAVMRSVTEEPASYRVTIILRDREDEATEALFEEFQPIPPPPPGLPTRIAAALSANPIIPMSVVLIIFSLVIWYLVGSRRSPKPFALQRPPMDALAVHPPRRPTTDPRRTAPRPASGPRILLRVRESPGMMPDTERVIDRFPYKIGREDFPHDQKVSRSHAIVWIQDNQLYIQDVASSNGTFINGVALPANVPTVLPGMTMVRLGMHTYCEFDWQE